MARIGEGGYKGVAYPATHPPTHPSMRHGKQGVTRASPLALAWPATAHSRSAPLATPETLLEGFGQ